jgi:hypothetical protein
MVPGHEGGGGQARECIACGTGRVLDYSLDFVRASYRRGFEPGHRSFFVGFRVVCVSPIV